jgi:hypothetical protein
MIFLNGTQLGINYLHSLKVHPDWEKKNVKYYLSLLLLNKMACPYSGTKVTSEN